MLSISQLCTKYGNEEVHTQHVTALALQLFDATHRWLELPSADRRILEAACRLHDIGYSVDPENHPNRSAQIVIREGLVGFRPVQRRIIARVLRLHSGNSAHRDHEAEHVLALASFLRIADGLDHGHVQDAVILKISRVRDLVLVRVSSDQFPYNLVRADRKADLWRSVFPLEIQFVAARVARRKRPALIHADLPVLEAARKLMSLQLKTVTIHMDGVIAATDALALRDLRVAMRRLRLLLRVFRKRLPKSMILPLDAELKQINRGLSPVRDLGVWMSYWENPDVQQTLARNRLWRTFVDYQKQRRRSQWTKARGALRRPGFDTLRTQLNWLLRVELPRLICCERPGNLKKLAARKLDKALRRALKRGRFRRHSDPGKVHRLRRALRELRYLGGFFGPLLGPTIEKLTRRVHSAERAVAQIHDVDVTLARVREEQVAPPTVLLKRLEAHRREASKEADAAWERLTQHGFLRRVEHTLKSAR